MIYGDGTCAVCHRPARDNQLMCRVCWYATPRLARNRVLNAWKDWQEGEETLGYLRNAQDAAVIAAGGKPCSAV